MRFSYSLCANFCDTTKRTELATYEPCKKFDESPTQ